MTTDDRPARPRDPPPRGRPARPPRGRHRSPGAAAVRGRPRQRAAQLAPPDPRPRPRPPRHRPRLAEAGAQPAVAGPGRPRRAAPDGRRRAGRPRRRAGRRRRALAGWRARAGHRDRAPGAGGARGGARTGRDTELPAGSAPAVVADRAGAAALADPAEPGVPEPGGGHRVHPARAVRRRRPRGRSRRDRRSDPGRGPGRERGQLRLAERLDRVPQDAGRPAPPAPGDPLPRPVRAGRPGRGRPRRDDARGRRGRPGRPVRGAARPGALVQPGVPGRGERAGQGVPRRLGSVSSRPRISRSASARVRYPSDCSTAPSTSAVSRAKYSAAFVVTGQTCSLSGRHAQSGFSPTAQR
ncbi:hypothetical protein L7F22_007020 [Adiantum nelumboides]|nr:hypothetical protein [Adiantum nelumboides]